MLLYKGLLESHLSQTESWSNERNLFWLHPWRHFLLALHKLHSLLNLTKTKRITVIEQGWAKYCDLLVASRSILLFTKAEGLG